MKPSGKATSSFTPDDPFDLQRQYGYQTYNRKFVYNFFFVYQPLFFKGQAGFLGRALGGWTLSSVFSAGSGAPVEIFTSTGDGQEFGAGDNSSYFGNENAVEIAPIKSGHASQTRPSQLRPNCGPGASATETATTGHDRSLTSVAQKGQSDFHRAGAVTFGLTRLLPFALLSRFSRMGQLRPGEINFERQPGQIRAVCDSEQDFRNAGGGILQ